MIQRDMTVSTFTYNKIMIDGSLKFKCMKNRKPEIAHYKHTENIIKKCAYQLLNATKWGSGDKTIV